MKRITKPTRRAGPLALALLMLAGSAASPAAKFTRAELTKLVNQVQLLDGGSSSRPASLGATISGSTAVQTGQKSRAELQFPDRSIVRLGSNSVFSFTGGSREVELGKGTLLMQVPKSLGRTKIKTAAISAAITGTTILFEFVPAVLDEFGNVIRPGFVKIIVVEGSLEFALNSAPRRTLRLLPGEMVAFPADAQELPRKFNIDLQRLIKTSKLMDGGMGPLPDQPIIRREVVAQNELKRAGRLLEIGARRKAKSRPFLVGNPNRGISRARVAVNARPAPAPVPVVRVVTRTEPETRTLPPAPIPVPLPDRPDRNTPPGTTGP